MRFSTLAVAILLGSTTALAGDSPERLVDQLHFYGMGGLNRVGAASITNPRMGTVTDVVSGPKLAVGFGEIWWPKDWIGWDVARFELQDGTFDSVGCAGCTASRISLLFVRVSTSLRLALPLKYFGPYVGAGPMITVMGDSTDVPTQPNAPKLFARDSASLGLRAFAGATVYWSRDFRFFVEGQYLQTDISTRMRAANQQDSIGDPQQLSGLNMTTLMLGVEARASPIVGHVPYSELATIGLPILFWGIGGLALAVSPQSGGNP
jgi:hypothetical protein